MKKRLELTVFALNTFGVLALGGSIIAILMLIWLPHDHPFFRIFMLTLIGVFTLFVLVKVAWLYNRKAKRFILKTFYFPLLTPKKCDCGGRIINFYVSRSHKNLSNANHYIESSPKVHAFTQCYICNKEYPYYHIKKRRIHFIHYSFAAIIKTIKSISQ